jgi:hypothetical protein
VERTEALVRSACLAQLHRLTDQVDEIDLLLDFCGSAD